MSIRPGVVILLSSNPLVSGAMTREQSISGDRGRSRGGATAPTTRARGAPAFVLVVATRQPPLCIFFFFLGNLRPLLPLRGKSALHFHTPHTPWIGGSVLYVCADLVLSRPTRSLAPIHPYSPSDWRRELVAGNQSVAARPPETIVLLLPVLIELDELPAIVHSHAAQEAGAG